METSWCEALAGSAAADALVANHAGLVAAEAREILAVAHWADLHGVAAGAGADGGGRVLAGLERARCYGGAGTPAVGEFAVHELAVLLGVGVGSAEHLLRDALDLRHRHPRLWARLVEASRADGPGADPARAVGLPRVWQARQVAVACHRAGLSREQARWVDAQTTPRLGRCNWGRFATELAGAVIEADPAAAQAREDAERLRRFVATGRGSEHGVTTLIARVEAGDAVAFKAICDLIAGYLRADGDTGSADVRRSKAVGILANPPAAVAFLLAHGYATGSPTSSSTDSSTGSRSTSSSGAGSSGASSGTAGAEDSTEDSTRGSAAASAADSAAGSPARDGGMVGGRCPGVGEQLDLFGDRRVHECEPTQTPGGAGEDVPVDTILGGLRNAGWHDREPDPDPGPDDAPEPEADPAPDPAPDDGPDDRDARGRRQPAACADPGPPDEGCLRPGDLHPAADDSEDRPCPTCGASPAGAAGAGEGSVLNRVTRALRWLETSGVLDKLTTIDPARLLPKVTCYVHFDATRFRRDAQGVVRFEGGIGPMSAATAMEVLGHSRVSLKPVIDLAGQVPADGYEVPRRLREALHLAMPGSVFPYAAYTGQTYEQQDADHTRPYRPRHAGGAAGQTRLDNLGFLGRGSHRVKTFAPGWRHHQPLPGVHLWRTRHGYWYRVDATGTHPLGRHPDLTDTSTETPAGTGTPLERHFAALLAARR